MQSFEELWLLKIITFKSVLTYSLTDFSSVLQGSKINSPFFPLFQGFFSR